MEESRVRGLFYILLISAVCFEIQSCWEENRPNYAARQAARAQHAKEEQETEALRKKYEKQQVDWRAIKDASESEEPLTDYQRKQLHRAGW